MTAALFGHVLATEARKRLTYRADFWFGAVLGLAAHFAVAYFVTEALFAESGRALVGGYTRGGLLVYYLLVVLFGKIVASIELEQSIGQDIYEGGLTRYLVYPAPYPLFKYAQQLGALTPIVVQIALVGLLAPLVLRLESFPLTADTVARGLASLALANLLYFVFTWPLQAVAFWADNVWSLIIAWRFGAWLLGA